METKQKTDVYTIVTNRIIEQLQNNVVPWQKPWSDAGLPQNLVTKIPYRGLNVWMLASLGYAQNYFLTWKQLGKLGGTLKKGEKGHIVTFWEKVPKDKDGDVLEGAETTSALRYYLVYNIAQCDGLPEVCSIPPSPHTISRLDACEEIIDRMPNCPLIKFGKSMAFYDPQKDLITIPKLTNESYYRTLFPELVHSTGHGSRLNRKAIVENPEYASELYSQEALVAEIGACYLNSVAGIGAAEFDNSVAYINGWLMQLKNDKRLIFYASYRAQKAVEYILDVKPYVKTETTQEELAETP